MNRSNCHIGDRLWLHRGRTWQRVRIKSMGAYTARLVVEHNDHQITKPYTHLWPVPKGATGGR